MNATEEFTWTDDMDDIGGLSSGYEACCRMMTAACVDWLRKRQHPIVDGRVTFTEEQRAELDEALDIASGRQSSGAQMGAAFSHGSFIYVNGWDAYAKRMRERKAKYITAASSPT